MGHGTCPWSIEWERHHAVADFVATATSSAGSSRHRSAMPPPRGAVEKCSDLVGLNLLEGSRLLQGLAGQAVPAARRSVASPCFSHVGAAIGNSPFIRPSKRLGSGRSGPTSACRQESPGELARLVRPMNGYPSDLIEGHVTHRVDIEWALHADCSKEPRKRDLQLEARSHSAVQPWIDPGSLKGRAATAAGISEIHRRFCQELPDSLLTVENPDAGTRH